MELLEKSQFPQQKVNRLPSVSVVIPVYKNFIHKTLIRDIEASDYPKDKLEIILVAILSKIEPLYKNKVRMRQILISQRIGYGQAANIGIKNSHGEYILLLNSDVKIESQTLPKMVEYLVRNTKIGVVGPKILSMSNPHAISLNDLPVKYFNKKWGKIFPVKRSVFSSYISPQSVDWLSGCALLFKRTVWKFAQGFDESLFLYWEDADFCMRVKQLGYKVVLLPQALVCHKGSASVRETPDKTYYLARNGRYFLQRYSQWLGHLILHVVNFLLLGSKSFQYILGINDRMNTLAFITGIIDYYRGKRGMRYEK